MLAPHALPEPTVAHDVAVAYADPPWWYDARGFFILKLAYRGSLWSQVAFFEKHLSDNHLELAVGTGTLFRYVLRLRRWRRARLPDRVVGIDYAPAMLAGARRKFRRWPEVQLEQGDAAELGFADGSFDSVSVANAFHCFPDPDAALGEVMRVLAPGGTLAMNVLLHPRGGPVSRRIARAICNWGMRKGILHTPYALDDLQGRLHAHGFEVEQEWVSGNAYYVVARKPAE
jgi:ubiquinone/menaquinone biosynthesis C-methylase UbiE